MSTIRFLVSILLLLTVVFTTQVACRPQTPLVTLEGSDTLALLVDAWASNHYEPASPDGTTTTISIEEDPEFSASTEATEEDQVSAFDNTTPEFQLDFSTSQEYFTTEASWAEVSFVDSTQKPIDTEAGPLSVMQPTTEETDPILGTVDSIQVPETFFSSTTGFQEDFATEGAETQESTSELAENSLDTTEAGPLSILQSSTEDKFLTLDTTDSSLGQATSTTVLPTGKAQVTRVLDRHIGIGFRIRTIETQEITTTENTELKKPTLKFLLLVFLFLPIVNTFTRHYSWQNRVKACYGCCWSTIFTILPLVLVLVTHLKDKGTNASVASIFLSVSGVMWTACMLVSLIAALLSPFPCVPYRKVLKITTYFSDLALIYACLLENKFGFLDEVKLLLGFKVAYWALGIWLGFYVLANLFVLLVEYTEKYPIIRRHRPPRKPRVLPRRSRNEIYGPQQPEEPSTDEEEEEEEGGSNVDEPEPEQSAEAEKEAETPSDTTESLKSQLAETHTYIGDGDRSAVPTSTSKSFVVIQIEDDEETFYMN